MGATTQARLKGNRRSKRWLLLLGVAVLAVLVAVGTVLVGGAHRAGDALIATDPASHLHALVIDPGDARHLLLGQHSGLVESHDGGTSWHWVSGPLAHGMLTALIAADGGIVYAAAVPLTNGPPLGLWRSHDAGHTWQSVRTPSPNVTALAAAPGRPALLYVALFGHGIYVTTSGGTWRRLAGNLQDQGLGSLAVDPHHPDRILAGTVGGLWMTGDGGRSWRTLPALKGQVVVTVAFAPWPGHDTAVAGSASGLWRSDDGGTTWRLVARAPAGGIGISALSLSGSPDADSVVGTTTGLYAVSLTQGTWRRLGDALPATTVAVLAQDPRHNATLYVGYSFPTRLYKSTDAGVSWSKLAGP